MRNCKFLSLFLLSISFNHLNDATDDFEDVIRFLPDTEPGPPVFYLALSNMGGRAPPILPLPAKSGSDALDNLDALDILLISPLKLPSFSR